jgi:hypothetical protein
LTAGGETPEYKSGTEMIAEGAYKILFADANGYGRIYTFTIDKTAPDGALSGAVSGGLTNKTVTLMYDEADAVGAIFKDGEAVGVYKSGTKITESGAYVITLTDRAGNVTEYTFTIDKLMPEVELVGVESGGQTGGGIIIRNPNKACEVVVTRNDAVISYAFGDALTQEGGYKVTLTDSAGNETVYTFDIVYAVNAAGTVVIIIVLIAVLGGIVVVWFMRKRKVFKKK